MYVMRNDMKKLQGKQPGEKDKPAPDDSHAASRGAGQPVVVDVPKGKLAIIKDRCKGCGFCIEFCPKKVLELSSERGATASSEYNAKGYHIPMVKDPDKCILCGFCTMYCPDFAIYQIRPAHCKQTKNDKAEKK